MRLATVEAAMARIIPTDDLPGAREAGFAHFIDHQVDKRYLLDLQGYLVARPMAGGRNARRPLAVLPALLSISS